MIWLNNVNGADLIESKYAQKALEEFEKPIGAVMGSAYGGSLEHIGKMWKEKGGVIMGFDVFEETHPKHLSEDQSDHEATCMEHWYQDHIFGTKKLSYDYQRQQLDDQGLSNVILVKGEVQPESCKDTPYLNYVFLDMDILLSMDNGYRAVKDKIVPGGYLLMHDVTGNLKKLIPWFNEILESGLWEEVERVEESLVVVLKRR